MRLQHLLCKCEKDPVFFLYIQDFLLFFLFLIKEACCHEMKIWDWTVLRAFLGLTLTMAKRVGRVWMFNKDGRRC